MSLTSVFKKKMEKITARNYCLGLNRYVIIIIIMNYYVTVIKI